MVPTEVPGTIYRHNLAMSDEGRPFLSLSNDVDLLCSQILSLNLLDESDALRDELRRDPIYKIEWNLWKNREHIEEIIDLLLDKSRWPPILRQPSTPEDNELARVLDEIADVIRGPLANLVSFQDMISERVFSAVTAVLPQSIRRILIRKREDREMFWKAKLDDLVTSGASKGARCALLCERYTDLRSWLIMVAAPIGFFETSTDQNEISLRKVVLDAFPTIHDEDWPMEDLQRRVGPQLYHLTTMILSIRLFVSLLWGRYEASKLKKNHVILKKAVDVYIHEFERVITYTREVFEGSPLSTSAVVGCGMSGGDFKEISVSAWETREVSLEVDTINSKIAWDFSLFVCGSFTGKLNWDIDFSVECTDASGETTILLPKKRCRADKGSLVTLLTGKYKLIFDNTNHYLMTKFLRYKLELYTL